MNWKFVKVSGYGWMLEVSDVGVLMEYYLQKTLGPFRVVFADVKSIFTDNKKWCGPGHPRTRGAEVVMILSELKKKSVADCIGLLVQATIKGQIECIESCGSILINRNGGYFPGGRDELMGAIETDSLMWPLDSVEARKVRYLKWPGGSHWYVKIGNEDLVVDGEQKWDTRELAEQAVRTYVEELKNG